jgi:hypothetical protein
VVPVSRNPICSHCGDRASIEQGSNGGRRSGPNERFAVEFGELLKCCINGHMEGRPGIPRKPSVRVVAIETRLHCPDFSMSLKQSRRDGERRDRARPGREASHPKVVRSKRVSEEHRSHFIDSHCPAFQIRRAGLPHHSVQGHASMLRLLLSWYHARRSTRHLTGALVATPVADSRTESGLGSVRVGNAVAALEPEIGVLGQRRCSQRGSPRSLFFGHCGLHT